MKKRSVFSLLLAFVLLLSLLTGCGGVKSGSYGNSAMDTAMDMEIAEAPAADAPSAVSDSGFSTDSTGIALPENRKLIRTVYMEAQTQDMDALLTETEQLIVSLEGYTESREVYSGSSSVSQWRNANLTIRIPADKADIFLGQVEKTANVTSVSETLEDVTLDYVATESRIKALETEQERLLALMEQAENLTDLLEIEARLTDVLAELEAVTSQLRLYDNQIDYATIHLSIRQVTELTTPADEMTVWQRIAAGFTGTLRDLGDTLVDIFVWLIAASPVLLLLAILVTVIVLFISRICRKKAAKKQPPKDTENNA